MLHQELPKHPFLRNGPVADETIAICAVELCVAEEQFAVCVHLENSEATGQETACH